MTDDAAHTELPQAAPRRWVRGVLILMAAAVVAIIVSTWQIMSNPMRGTDDEIRAWLYALTPHETSQQSVQNTLDARGWDNPANQKTLPQLAKKPFLGGTIGGYQGLPWYVFVQAYWEFDEQGQLSDIRIRRLIDSP
jgi:hypothetical protein